MTAKELHEACYDAISQCPQFRGFDDDQYFQGFGEYQNIPKKGMYKTIQFWKEFGYLLWDYGYYEALPQEVQKLFDDIDDVINEAIKNHCKSL